MTKAKPKTFANRLRLAREVAAISIAELARRADVPYRTLQDIELGTNADPRFSTVCKLAAALGVPLEKLRA